MGALTRQIGGTAADIDRDLETLRLIKIMLMQKDAVKVGRSRHDKGFLEMLMQNPSLRKLGGFELFDSFNRRLTMTVGQLNI